jgi:hypothetical protein
LFFKKAAVVNGVAAIMLFTSAVRAAEDHAEATPSPQTDAHDLWRSARHKQHEVEDQDPDEAKHRFVVLAPTISSKPSTGPMVGVGAAIAFVDGDPSTTHMSSALASLKVSFKQQALSSVRFGAFTAEDHWFLQGDNRAQWTSLNTYEVGAQSPISSAENLKYTWLRVYETAYRRVGSRVFVGFGVNVNDHSNVRSPTGTASLDEAAYTEYSDKHGFAIEQQGSGGTNFGVLFDSRDNSISAGRGWLASAVYRTFFDGFAGGDSTWQELNLDVRTYRKLTNDGRQKLAFWFLGDLVTGGIAPYFDLPSTANDMYGRSARGYAEGRYRAPRLLYGELEYRATLVPSGLVGAVAFLNTTTLDGDVAGQKLFQSFLPGAGFGARVLLDKHSHTNVCIDYGWGRQGSHGFYLAMQEVF